MSPELQNLSVSQRALVAGGVLLAGAWVRSQEDREKL